MRKAAYLLLMIANLAVDLLLPTLVLLVLAPAHLPTPLALSIGGTLLAAKAVGGPMPAPGFRWRLSALVAVVPVAVMLGSYAAGVDVRLSMVVGAILSGIIVTGGVVRDGRRRFDGFALLVLAEVLTGIVLTSIDADVRAPIYLAVGGVVVLASTWTERPFLRTALKPVATQGDPERAAAFDRCWERSPEFRVLYRLMTAGLGLVFLVDAAAGSADLLLIGLIVVWFATSRGLAVPRARRILEAELVRSRAPRRSPRPPRRDRPDSGARRPASAGPRRG